VLKTAFDSTLAPAYEQPRILKVSILGVTPIDGKRRAIMIPAGATVGLISRNARVASVVWGGQVIELFTQDLFARSLPA